MPVISRRLIVGRIVEDGRGQVQDRLLHDNRDKAVVVVVYRWGCQPQDRRARCNDGGRIPHVQRRAVLEDNFQRPPPPLPVATGRHSRPAATGGDQGAPICLGGRRQRTAGMRTTAARCQSPLGERIRRCMSTSTLLLLLLLSSRGCQGRGRTSHSAPLWRDHWPPGPT